MRSRGGALRSVVDVRIPVGAEAPALAEHVPYSDRQLALAFQVREEAQPLDLCTGTILFFHAHVLRIRRENLKSLEIIGTQL